MPHSLIHVAIKVPDLERAIDFYCSMYGYRVREQHEHDGHRSCHLDGAGVDLSLMQYETESSPGADLCGPGPAIHHLGFEVDDLAAGIARLEAAGCVILSARDEVPVKYRGPDGVIGELFTPGYFSPGAPAS